MAKGPLKLRELLKRLKPYGIISLEEKGKGSHRMLLKPTAPGSMTGPQIPVKCHGMGTEISIPVIDAILRRFEIDDSTFWNN